MEQSQDFQLLIINEIWYCHCNYAFWVGLKFFPFV